MVNTVMFPGDLAVVLPSEEGGFMPDRSQYLLNKEYQLDVLAGSPLIALIKPDTLVLVIEWRDGGFCTVMTPCGIGHMYALTLKPLKVPERNAAGTRFPGLEQVSTG